MISYRTSIERMLEKIVIKLIKYDRQPIKIDKSQFKGTLLELWLLRELDQEALSIQVIADRVDLNRALVTRSIDQLIRQGLIEKQRTSLDRRIQKISLTQLGCQFSTALKDQEFDYFDFVIKDLTVNEQKAVLKFLSRLNQLTVEKYDIK